MTLPLQAGVEVDHQSGLYAGGNFSGAVDALESTSYLYLNYAAELPYELTLKGPIGSYDFKGPVFLSTEEYRDFQLSIGRALFGLDIYSVYADTNLSDTRCSDFAGYAVNCDSNWTMTVFNSF